MLSDQCDIHRDRRFGNKYVCPSHRKVKKSLQSKHVMSVFEFLRRSSKNMKLLLPSLPFLNYNGQSSLCTAKVEDELFKMTEAKLEDTLEKQSTLSIVPNQGLTATTSSSATSTSSVDGSETNASSPQHQSLDFIGTAHAVKNLFSIPYHSSDQPLCFAVHNLDGTLLIDDTLQEDDESTFDGSRRTTSTKATSREQSNSSSQSLLLSPAMEKSLRSDNRLSMLGSIMKQVKQMDQEESSSALNNYLNPVREYIEWKFQDANLLVGSDALIVKPEDTKRPAVSIRVEEVNNLQTILQKSQQEKQQQQLMLESSKDNTAAQRSYAQAVLRTPSNEEKVDHELTPESQSGFSPKSLDHVRLQTCIVPSSGPFGGLLDGPSSPRNPATPTTTGESSLPSTSSLTPSPACIVLDAYLDNIMGNVPQLALCLQEKGLMRSVKLMQTEEIPSMMLHPTTLDTSSPVGFVGAGETEDLFSPQIMEMNASALLRFLKANCTRNNSTYLLRRESGEGPNNIQLYDISSISSRRQKKWIWWLATMSYRFALRLRHLELNIQDLLPMRKRAFRDRQRSLYQTTLDLLQDLFDMEGSAHESLVASVREHMADTFLGESSAEASNANTESTSARRRSSSPTFTPQSPPPVLSSSPTLSPVASPIQKSNSRKSMDQQDHYSSHQPYSRISIDALNKAQDHLDRGIKSLWPVLEKHLEPKKTSNGNPGRRRKRTSAGSPPSKPHDILVDSVEDEEPPAVMAMQLFGLNFKVVNVSLRLADYHLRNYYSSSAMQELRKAGRRMATLAFLLKYIASPNEWIHRLQHQYVWLWEHCGHFARSFASDELWRDRGHACGDDVISLLRDVDAAFSFDSYGKHFKSSSKDPLQSKTRGMVSLNSLSAVVRPFEVDRTVGDDGIEAARSRLAEQGQLLRDRRQVLVASCVSYSRAILAFEDMYGDNCDPELNEKFQPIVLDLLYKRLGDACNETGKAMLGALKNLLGDSAASGEKTTPLAAKALLDSAEFWFDFGLGAFESCKDLQNIALLRCNLCQCFKLRTNSSLISKEKAASYVESCLEEAASHLLTAHESLGEREVDPMTWDMVSEELAATFLVLAVRRRQSLLGGGNSPILLQSLRLSPGKERSVMEPMEKALKIYDQSGNAKQAAAVHYQLALTNAKIWTCQRDEAKTREKLSAAFQHYNMAFHYFSTALRGNEPTFVLLCLDLASLYAAVSGEECLRKALLRCLDTYRAFSMATIEIATVNSNQAAGWLSNMETLADNVEERVFKLLRSLVKLEGERYKEAYREGLSVKMAKRVAENEQVKESPKLSNLLSLHDVLIAIREKMSE